MDIIEEFKQLVEIDSASGKERAIADVLKKKLTALGFGVLEDNAGSTFGGDTGNLIAIK
jgi:tripeptide aminopeptidase